MNKNLKGLIALVLVMFHSAAFSQSVYHCYGADGEKTFSFAPCAQPEPAEKQLSEPVVEASLEQIQPVADADPEMDIDLRIAELQDRLDQIRLEYHEALDNNQGKSTNAATTAYDKASSEVLEELMQLYQSKREVAVR